MVGTNRIPPLPSPSASDTHSKEVSEQCPILSWGYNCLTIQRSQPCTPANNSEEGKRERPTGQVLFRKRKHTQDIEDLTPPSLEKPVKKQRPPLLPEFKEPETVPKDSNCYPVEFWAKHQIWPPKFAEKDPNMSEQNPKKRSSSSSYTQGVKDGQNPRPHTAAHERDMVKYDMIMDIFQNQTTISDDSKQLCADFLSARYALPKDTLFEDKTFEAVFRRARTRNEARLNRDITPLIVPSAELLYIRNIANLEHVIEELDAEWNYCSVIFGPKPKPDYVAGLASSAFNFQENLKLQLYHTVDYPARVTDCLYFPFLICEVKSADKTVMEAERQAMHSGSIATRAIIRLYEKVSRAEELNRKILVFSISHDPSAVKIYGHYALIEEDGKTTFFRHLIRSFDFTELNGKERWTAYHFTRKIYDNFYRKHVDRIRSALSQLDSHRPVSLTSNPSFNSNAEGPDSQGLVASAPSSQSEARGFKKPSLPSTSMLQGQNDRLFEQMRQQQEQISKLQDLLLQQKDEEKHADVELRRENDRLHEQISMLLRQQQEQQRQQQEQQRQQQEQQRQQQEQYEKQIEQQRQQHKEQMEHYKEIIEMLRQQKP